MSSAIERTLSADAVQRQSNRGANPFLRLASQPAVDADSIAPARGSLEHLAALERSAAELGGASMTVQAMQTITKVAREAQASKLKQREARLEELTAAKELIIKQAELEFGAATLKFAGDVFDGIGDLTSGMAYAKKNKAQGKINEASGDLAAAGFSLASAGISSEAKKVEADQKDSQLRSDLFKETQESDAASFEQARDLAKQMLEQHNRAMSGLTRA